MNWRRLNTVLHRDIGYLAVGLTIVYGVSGLAVNHAADWNPSYRLQKTTQRIAPIAATDRAEIVREVLRKLAIHDEPDVYAVALIVMAITGMFVLKGATGITGRGAWLTTAGVLLPAAYWVYHLYLE